MRLFNILPFLVLPAVVVFSEPAPRSADSGLILQASEGKRGVRRPPPSNVAALAVTFIIKVDQKNGGSPDFLMGSAEEFAATRARHRADIIFEEAPKK